MGSILARSVEVACASPLQQSRGLEHVQLHMGKAARRAVMGKSSQFGLWVKAFYPVQLLHVVSTAGSGKRGKLYFSDVWPWLMAVFFLGEVCSMPCSCAMMHFGWLDRLLLCWSFLILTSPEVVIGFNLAFLVVLDKILVDRSSFLIFFGLVWRGSWWISDCIFL